MYTPIVFNLLIRLSRSFEASLMKALIEQGFEGLNMSFADPMMVLAQGQIRMNALAERLGMSKQLCNQALKPLEQLGVLERIPDPDDGRAKLVVLTTRGWELIERAGAIIESIEQQLLQVLDEQELSEIKQLLLQLSKAADIKDAEIVPLVSLMSILSRHFERQLMHLTGEQGFVGLQMSYAQVLNYMQPAVSPSISALAQINHVSVQAISRICTALENEGYIVKQSDSEDRRVKVLKLTDKGEALFHASLSSVDTLNEACWAYLSAEKMQRCQSLLMKMSKSLSAAPELLTVEDTSPEGEVNFNAAKLVKLLDRPVNFDAITQLSEAEQESLLALLEKI